jgi:hypothetical protein
VAEISGVQAAHSACRDAETTPGEYQHAGWQAILDNFARHVMAR